MILIFTGNGKGKTTAALGQAVRVLGNDKRVFIIQFIKSPKWPTGEEAALKKFGKQCKIYKGGKGFVGIMGDKLPKGVHKKAARKTWDIAKTAITSGKFDLVILDEINIAVALGLLNAKEVATFFKKNRMVNHTINYTILDVILTGRYAPRDFIKIADLVTECREVKHQFRKGKWGERGREY